MSAAVRKSLAKVPNLRKAVGPWAIAGALFLLALAPRVIGLGSYVTHDEPFWLLSSIRCVYGLAQGDLSAAFQTAHPGVPPLIGHGILLWVYYTLTGRPDIVPAIAESGWVIWFPPHLYHLLPEMIAAAGLFTAVVSALAVAGAYLLLRLLFEQPGDSPVAGFAGLFLALDPYFLALSRVVGVDAALASFMLLSVLSLLVYFGKTSRTWALVGAGVLAALAILTKTSAGFLIPFTLFTLPTFVIFCLFTGRPTGWSVQRWLITAVVWTGAVLAAFLCLWPATWQNPAAALTRLAQNVQAVVGIPHESASYFLGQMTLDPGWLYYWVVLLFRLTPLTLPLGLLGIVLLIADLARGRRHGSAMPMLLLYAGLFLAMMSLAAKKQERYVLPSIVVMDVLAAWALVRLLDWLARMRRLELAPTWRRWGAVGLILVTSLWWFRLHPHYYVYQNPLLGGSPAADWVYMTGWGEGNELAAAYLNQQPAAADVVTVASFDAGVGAYTPGVVLWLSPETIPLADYAVVHEGSIRHDPTSSGLIDFFASRSPVHTVYLDGIPYVRVYALTDAPQRWITWHLSDEIQHPQCTMVGQNIACRGYDSHQTTAPAGGTLTLTVHWQCLDYLAHDYNVFVHLVDPRTGIRWGQWDGAPVNGHFPTSWWRPGLAIRDPITIAVDPAAPPGEYQLQAGLYDFKTGERLWVGEKGAGRDSVDLGTITITPPGGAP